MRHHDYPNVFGRLSTFFIVAAILLLTGAVAQVIFALREGVVTSLNPLATLLGAAACYAVHIVLDFLLDLSERIAYIERIQQQQNKMLVKIHDQQKGEMETEIA